jgi:hypothetical protein
MKSSAMIRKFERRVSINGEILRNAQRAVNYKKILQLKMKIMIIP